MAAIKIRYIEKKDIRNIKDYHTVSHDRWNDALLCYQKENYFASVYLAGYCAECILKYAIVQTLFSQKLAEENLLNISKICKENREYKSLKDHKINQLIKLGASENVFKGIKDQDFKDIIAWSSEWRYAITHNISEDLAGSFLKSVARLSDSLEKEMSGNIKIRAFNYIEKEEVN